MQEKSKIFVFYIKFSVNISMHKYKKIRMTFILPENVEQILRKLSDKTDLKLSKIVEKGILMFEEKNK